MSSVGQTLVWIMGKDPYLVALGSIYGTNALVYLRWDDTQGPGSFINRSRFVSPTGSVDGWLEKETERLARDGYVMVVEPGVRVMNLPEHSTADLEKWAETVLFTRIMQEFGARV